MTTLIDRGQVWTLGDIARIFYCNGCNVFVGEFFLNESLHENLLVKLSILRVMGIRKNVPYIEVNLEDPPLPLPTLCISR